MLFAFASPHTRIHTHSLCLSAVQKLTLIHVNSNQCLDKASEEDSQVPSVRDCTHSRSQQWLLRNVTLPEVFWPHLAHLQTHTFTHTVAQSKLSREGTVFCFFKSGTRKGKTSHEGIQENRRTEWTVLPLPQIRGEECVWPERLPLGDGGCCFPFASVVFKEILTAESDSLLGVDMRRAGGVEVLHSQLPWTKQSTPQLIT